MRPRSGLLSGLAVLLFGCGLGGKTEVALPRELGQVEGEVTLDGRPLAGALVLFLPPAESDPWRESKGMTDQNGHYELTFFGRTQGAIPGEHTIRITCPDPRDVERQIVPPQYNVQTTLKRTVENGPNRIDFELKGK